MRTVALVLALGLAAVPLALLAPAEAAYSVCTSLAVPGHQCQSHFVCVGWNPRPYPYGEECTVGLPLSCETCRALP